MGQRLVVEIYNGDERLANAYYHWSGYTSSSSSVTKYIIEEYMNYLKGETFFEDKHKDLVYKAVRMLAASGAALQNYEDGDELDSFNKMFPDLDDELKISGTNNRNQGLISINEESMDNSYAWNEALVTINIASETVDFDACWTEDYISWYDDNFYNCFFDRSREEVPKEWVTDSLKKVKETLEKRLITESTAADLEERIKDCGYIYSEEMEEPIMFDNDINIGSIPMEDYWEFDELLTKVYNSDQYCFQLKNDPNTVYNMIE